MIDQVVRWSVFLLIDCVLKFWDSPKFVQLVMDMQNLVCPRNQVARENALNDDVDYVKM